MNLFRVFQSSARSAYIQDKTKIVSDCETKFFQLSTELDTVKTSNNWDKTQSLIDKRVKLVTECMKQLAIVDKGFIDKLTKSKE